MMASALVEGSDESGFHGRKMSVDLSKTSRAREWAATALKTKSKSYCNHDS
jgi:hypothetical protein